MNLWPKVKSLALLLLASLTLNASIYLYLCLRFPSILGFVDIGSPLGHSLLLQLALDTVKMTLASALIPAFFLLFNYRLSAYGALLIGILCLQLPPAVALGQLLILLWVVIVALWFAWKKCRDVYHYYRTK